MSIGVYVFWREEVERVEARTRWKSRSGKVLMDGQEHMQNRYRDTLK